MGVTYLSDTYQFAKLCKQGMNHVIKISAKNSGQLLQVDLQVLDLRHRPIRITLIIWPLDLFFFYFLFFLIYIFKFIFTCTRTSCLIV